MSVVHPDSSIFEKLRKSITEGVRVWLGFRKRQRRTTVYNRRIDKSIEIQDESL